MNKLKLMTPLEAKGFNAKNRVFMAPMTRSRAYEQVVTDLMVEYYEQRASSGLIFSEGTQINAEAVGYIFTPGIYSNEHIEGWKKVTKAVHEKGGKIFAQLWHCGRVSHSDFHNGQLPLAPSAISFEGQSYTPQGMKPTPVPQAMSLDQIEKTVQDFKHAALAAMKAGFDGVEVHGANGYLPAQFLEDGSNQRSDMYGGTIENRARFLNEIVDAVISIWGAERVSVRISPRNPNNGMFDSNPEALYLHVVEQLEKRKLGILHVMEPVRLPSEVKPLATEIRKRFSGTLILNFGYDKKSAEHVVSEGLADAVSFGALFISNPDLPERFATDADLQTPDRATFYTGGVKGYVDYPALNAALDSINTARLS